jgi:hypothetical protein
MNSDWPFRFVNDPAAFRDAGALVVRIPRTARSKEKVLGVLAQALRFPRYFGWNWDALEECLGDLSWLPPTIERVILVHESLPFSPQGEQLSVYLDVLREAIRRREELGNHPALKVVFPQDAAPL